MRLNFLQLFFAENYIANGYGYLAKSSILRLDLASDLIFILSSVAIFLLLFYFLRQRSDIPFQKIFWLLCTLLMTCGITHLLELSTLWHPDYGLSSLFNAIAAGVALYMAGELVHLISKALALPNLSEPETANQSLATACGGYRGSEEFAPFTLDTDETITATCGTLHDITERHGGEAALAGRESYLAALVEVQRRLLALERDTQQGLIRQKPYNEILEILGQVSGASRVYLFENHQNEQNRLLMSQKAEWCAPGIPPKIENPTRENLAYEDFFPRWEQLLCENEIIAGVVAEFPESERVVLELQGILSILVLPLRVNSMFFGFIGFENCTTSRPWLASEVDLLETAAAALSLWNESVLAQLALRQSEATNRALLEAIPDALVRIHRDGTYLDFVPAKNKQTPISGSEFLGKKASEVLPRKLARKINSDVEAALLTGKVQVSEMPLQINEELHHYEIRTVFYSEDEVLMMGRDVTEQRSAEAALRESEERFRSLVDHIPGVVYRCAYDANRTVEFISDVIEEISGYQAAEFLHNQVRTFASVIVPEDRAKVEQIVVERLGKKQPYMLEYRIVRADGGVRWVYDKGQGVFAADGSLLCLDGVIFDITERKLAEVEILNALRQEKELGDLKSRFISITSHEFRTPLATIMSTAELLEYYEWTKEEEVEQLHLIQDAVKHMLELLNDLLFIGTAEAGLVRFNPEPLLLNEFCQELVAQIQQGMSLNPTDPGIQHFLNFVCQGESFLACMDKKLLRQLLSNLLLNAIKYSPHGGEILLELTCEEDKAIFEIQDQGIGIPTEDQSRLFEFFYRAKNVGAIAGTGLGLSIVKTCVDLHRGEIALKSAVGVGTRFTVSLPLKNSFCVPMLNNLPPQPKPHSLSC